MKKKGGGGPGPPLPVQESSSLQDTICSKVSHRDVASCIFSALVSVFNWETAFDVWWQTGGLGSTKPGLMGALHSAKIVTLKQCARAAGPVLTDAQVARSLLKARSVRLIKAESDPTESFPDLHLNPELLDLRGPLPNVCSEENLCLLDTDGLYTPVKKRW